MGTSTDNGLCIWYNERIEYRGGKSDIDFRVCNPYTTVATKGTSKRGAEGSEGFFLLVRRQDQKFSPCCQLPIDVVHVAIRGGRSIKIQMTLVRWPPNRGGALSAPRSSSSSERNSSGLAHSQEDVLNVREAAVSGGADAGAGGRTKEQ